MPSLTLYLPAKLRSPVALPLFINKIPAGFPSPADDYVEQDLDLNDRLIRNPAATFFGRAESLSMLDAGIHPNNLLSIDLSITPEPGHIVVCALNIELAVKRLNKYGTRWRLCTANPNYSDI